MTAYLYALVWFCSGFALYHTTQARIDLREGSPVRLPFWHALSLVLLGPLGWCLVLYVILSERKR